VLRLLPGIQADQKKIDYDADHRELDGAAERRVPPEQSPEKYEEWGTCIFTTIEDSTCRAHGFTKPLVVRS